MGILDVTLICLAHWRMSVVSHPSYFILFILQTLLFESSFFYTCTQDSERRSMEHISTCLIIVLYIAQLVIAREVWFQLFVTLILSMYTDFYHLCSVTIFKAKLQIKQLLAPGARVLPKCRFQLQTDDWLQWARHRLRAHGFKSNSGKPVASDMKSKV